jgi:hypothetical protein
MRWRWDKPLIHYSSSPTSMGHKGSLLTVESAQLRSLIPDRGWTGLQLAHGGYSTGQLARAALFTDVEFAINTTGARIIVADHGATRLLIHCVDRDAAAGRICPDAPLSAAPIAEPRARRRRHGSDGWKYRCPPASGTRRPPRLILVARTHASDQSCTVCRRERSSTPDSPTRWAGWPRAASRAEGLRRSPLLHMCAQGLIIRDHDQQLARLQDLARDRWAAGPAPLTDDDLGDRRYRLTALLDDVADEANPVDRAALAAAAFTDVADLALVSRGPRARADNGGDSAVGHRCGHLSRLVRQPRDAVGAVAGRVRLARPHPRRDRDRRPVQLLFQGRRAAQLGGRAPRAHRSRCSVDPRAGSPGRAAGSATGVSVRRRLVALRARPGVACAGDAYMRRRIATRPSTADALPTPTLPSPCTICTGVGPGRPHCAHVSPHDEAGFPERRLQPDTRTPRGCARTHGAFVLLKAAEDAGFEPARA